MATIEISSLTKRYGDTTAVDDLSFAAQPGTVTAFLGANGAGKTTTLRTLLGLVAPTSGSATIDGHRYAELTQPRRVVGALLEASGVHPGRTGRAHLTVVQQSAGFAPARIDEALELVGLTDAAGRKAGSYSLGMRQRLGLATAMLGDPTALVLDEPANGLDPQGIHWLRELLRGLAAQGRTVLLSSHLLAEVAQLADRVVIVDRGRLVRDATVAELAPDGTALEDVFLALTTPASSGARP
jgi:ABC-2 type transport system ATP-binding protein